MHDGAGIDYEICTTRLPPSESVKDIGFARAATFGTGFLLAGESMRQ